MSGHFIHGISGHLHCIESLNRRVGYQNRYTKQLICQQGSSQSHIVNEDGLNMHELLGNRNKAYWLIDDNL